MTRRGQKGTTLVEVLVAIVVLGILSAAVMSVSASSIQMSDTSNKQFFAQRWAFNAYEQFMAAGFDLSGMAGLDRDENAEPPGGDETLTLSWWKYQAADGTHHQICLDAEGNEVDAAGNEIPESALTELVRYFDRAWNPVQEGGYYTLLCSVASQTDADVTRTVFNVRVLDQAGEPLYSLSQPVSEAAGSGEVSP